MGVYFVGLLLFVSVGVSIAQARYFGPRMYDDDEAGPLKIDTNDDIYGGLEEPNQDQNVIMAPLSAFQPPISPDIEESGNENIFVVTNHARENKEWTNAASKSLSGLGHVSGIAASDDFLYVFHRANRTWDEKSFDPISNIFIAKDEPLTVDTVAAVDLVTGEIEFTWGKNKFFMPHSISVDLQGNVWVTDVALHQAFRFKKNSFDEPDLVLGERFTPGSDSQHFCKPTDVAVSSTGMVYIADGYCNSRVVVFSGAGEYLGQMGEQDKMQIPHSLALLESEDLLCVADRENGRVLCYNAGLQSSEAMGQLMFDVQHSSLSKLYGIGHDGDVILALNGGSDSSYGVSLDLATEMAVDQWKPENDTFHWAHDIDVKGKSFFVAQFGTQDKQNGNANKVIKFDIHQAQK